MFDKRVIVEEEFMKEAKKIQCRNVSDFVKTLQVLQLNNKDSFFRGQSNVAFNLKPSVLRDPIRTKYEDEIYLKVLSECSSEFESGMSHITILSKMQHYGVPTRLLDITTNALVALYFACDDTRNKEENGVVYIFSTDVISKKSFDSDVISILASIPRFTEEEKKCLKKEALKYNKEYESQQSRDFRNEVIQKFNSIDIVRRLLHEVKNEKPAFENIIKPGDLLENYFLIPKKDNPRIIRQSGAFIIVGLKNAIDPDKVKISKIRVPAACKETILEELEGLGISKITLHPELYKMAEYMNESLRKKDIF